MTPESHLNHTMPLLLHIVTISTGLIYAISNLALGHVFTANMTGNVVFLSFAVAGAPGLSLTRSLTALVAFLIGALIGGRVATRLSELVRPNWVTTALIMDVNLLCRDINETANCFGEECNALIRSDVRYFSLW